MRKINEKEWREICSNQIRSNGIMYKINTNHSFGMVEDGKMVRVRKNIFEKFSSSADVYVFLNGEYLQQIAELRDSPYKNGKDNPYYFLNSLHEAKHAINNFIDKYSLKENDFFDFHIELKVSRTCYVAYQNSLSSKVQLSSPNELHYDYEEAVKENPENKTFQHWEKERNNFNFGTRSFKSFVCFKSQVDGLNFTEDKIDEIRNKLMKEFNADMTPIR